VKKLKEARDKQRAAEKATEKQLRKQKEEEEKLRIAEESIA